MKLIIVESPAKCKKIEGFLGRPYKCVASFGHIREFMNGLKSLDADYNPKFKLMESKERYTSNLRRLIRNADEVILASDDDREGEAIAWHICDAFDLPIETTKRIIFHEITRMAITDAVRNPTTLDMNKVRAQQSRQILDLLVGFKLSPVLWKQINHTAGLSAGRCQTPALRLVYENQQEINKSPGKELYNTVGYFTEKKLPFALNFNYTTKNIEDFLEETVNFNHTFNCTKPRETTKKPPKPFTTSGLQQTSSNELHYSPKRTMQLAQKLYEGGYITYMRTDSITYSTEFVNITSKYINDKYGELYISPNIQKLTLRKKQGTKGAQEAHEAIRPTKITKTIINDNTIDNQAKRLYRLIWTNTIESCMADAIYTVIRASITSLNKHKYNHSEELVKFAGWKIVKGVEKVNPIYDYLLTIPKKEKMNYHKIESKFTLKELKTHYTEARLVHLLEKKGIGRPSTFSSLISKIQERNYVKKEDVKGREIVCVDYSLVGETLEEIETKKTIGNERNKLVIQPLGVIVIEFLLKYFSDLFDYSYTKQMEDELDKIAKGGEIWNKLCRDCDNELKKLIGDVPMTKKGLSIEIDEHHTYVIGKYGPVIKCKKGENTSFKKVRDDLDMDKLKEGGYSLEEIVHRDDILGKYEGKDVIIKKGKWGKYASYDGKNVSLKSIEGVVTMEKVIPFLKGERSGNPNILRVISKSISIRKGKWGKYLFYKTDKMSKPMFVSLKECDLNVMTCSKQAIKEWVSTNS